MSAKGANMLMCRSKCLVFSIFVGLFSSGCSSFEGSKLDGDGNLGDNQGIPYTMTKPDFRIVEKIDNGKSTFELQVAWIPDPSKRYTIRPSPGIFADSDFSIDLSPRGGLNATKLITTDRVGPTITALGTFVVAALTIAAVAAQPTFGEKLLKLAESNTCPGEQSGSVRESLLQYIAETNAEISKHIASNNLAGDKIADKIFQQRFHARTESERTCLEYLAKQEPEIKKDLTDILELSLQEWRARHLSYVRRQIEREVYRSTLRGADPDNDPRVRELRLELARTVGEEAAQRQLFKIVEQLELMPPMPSADSSAYTEYARMRGEAERLQERINTAIGLALAAAAGERPSPFIGSAPRVPIECVSEGKNCPHLDDSVKYVVVLQRADGAQ